MDGDHHQILPNEFVIPCVTNLEIRQRLLENDIEIVIKNLKK
jgi:hypothetical protein